MKEIISKILSYIKELFSYIINKIFKKVEDNIPDDLGARFYGPIEADPRDYRIENILGQPTDNELKALPSSIDLLSQVAPRLIPINQGCIPMCTIASLTNYITLQECIERKTAEIDGEEGAKKCRTLMGHKLQCNEHGDYLENALKCVKNNKLLSQITYYKPFDIKNEYLSIDGYAFSQANKEVMKYWLSKGFPLYYAFRGNKQTRIEMTRGEIKTYKFTPTGGHAVTAIGYDENYLYFINSWSSNDGSKYKGDYSIFKIKWSGLEEMLKYGLANRRFWVVYNTKDAEQKQIFEDYKIDENTEAGKAVKEMYDLHIIKGDNGKLYPNKPATRLEVIVMLDRIYNLLSKNDK